MFPLWILCRSENKLLVSVNVNFICVLGIILFLLLLFYDCGVLSRNLSNNTGISTTNLVLDILVVITLFSSFEIVARHFQHTYLHLSNNVGY